VPELAQVFRRYGGDYINAFGPALLPSHRRAMADIAACRTEVMGGHVFACDRCGHQQYAYHSCRNRHCPKCHRNDAEQWLARRREELLPVPYFHIIFTLPEALRGLARSRQKTVYGGLMQTAAQALMRLAADPRYVGGTIGVLAVLHTWGGALQYHPHVHCLVPAGGAVNGQWRPARKNYFVPVKALSRIFRAKFRDWVRRALPNVAAPKAAWRQPWVVYAKPAVQGTDNVLQYLGRYVHRVALTNHRILAVERGAVTFRYKDSRQACSKTMRLPAREFIRRFLQHVLPKGVHKVRYYGLWAPANRKLLRQIQTAFQEQPASPGPGDAGDDPPPSVLSPQALEPKHTASRVCPHCRRGVLRYLGPVQPNKRGPPA